MNPNPVRDLTISDILEMGTHSRNEALEEAAKIADEMTRASSIQLVAGEMTASELRAVKAVASYIKRSIIDLRLPDVPRDAAQEGSAGRKT